MLFSQDTTELKLKLERIEGERCCGLRTLWEEVFYEDSKEFTDYYFREKAARNYGYVLRGKEGTAAMLYLSPYTVMLRRGDGFGQQEINYIVGVATKEKYRHKGCMDRLLRAALQDMYGKGQPFAFLMPADPAIYRPYQFAYIYDRPEYGLAQGYAQRNGQDEGPGQDEGRAGQRKGDDPAESMPGRGNDLKEAMPRKGNDSMESVPGKGNGSEETRLGKENDSMESMPRKENGSAESRPGKAVGWPGHEAVKKIKAADPGSLPGLAGFAQEYLERCYDVFIQRDEGYYRVMEKELRAQKGGIILLKEDGKIKGYFLYTQETEGVEIQESVFDGEIGGKSWPVVDTGVKTPVIMARAVDVQTLLSLLWAEDGEVALDIRVSDPILEGNNGVWECIFAKEGTKVHKKELYGRKGAELKAASSGREGARAAAVLTGRGGMDGMAGIERMKELVEPPMALFVETEERDAGGAEADISVEMLVSWVFGYREARECFQFHGEPEEEKERILRQFGKVRRLGKVWINEIV